MTLRLPTPALLTLLVGVLAVLIALGTWQLSRHQEKQQLGKRLEGRTEAAALPLDRADAAPPATELDFRRVRIEGAWDHEHALVVANRVRFGTRGEHLIVPLLPGGGGPALLVDRGWYPRELREEVRDRLSEQAAGAARGMARDLDGGSARLAGEAGWTAFHPASMASALPYPVVDWGLIEGDSPLDTDVRAPPRPEELPQVGYMPYRNTVPHMQYALTWWGIAATLVVVATVRLWLVPRRHARGDTSASAATRGVDGDANGAR